MESCHFGWAGQPVSSRDIPVLTMQYWEYRHMKSYSAFNMSAGYSNSGFVTHLAISSVIFPTIFSKDYFIELSSQSPPNYRKATA